MAEMGRRKSARAIVTRLINESNDLIANKATVADDVNTMVDRLVTAKTSLDQAHEECSRLYTAENAEAEWNSVHEYNDKYVTAMAKLRSLLSKLNEGGDVDDVVSHADTQISNVSAASSRSRISHTKLAKLEIPKFCGDTEGWLSFWEMFKLAVHESDEFTNTEKFGFLKQYLAGPAKKALEGFSSTGACYEEAISLLINEYAQEANLTEHYFNKLTSLPKVKQASDTIALRKLYNDIVSISRSLNTLGLKPMQYLLTVKSVLLKSVPETIRLIILRDDVDNDPTGDDLPDPSGALEAQVERMLKTFKLEIDIRCKSHNAADQGEVAKAMRPTPQKCTASEHKRVFTSQQLSTQAKETCLFCDSTAHHTAECVSDKLTIEQKKDRLKQNYRCYRCTKTNHRAKDCYVSRLRCKKCQRTHATSMCDPTFGRSVQPKDEVKPVSETRQTLLANAKLKVFLKTAAAFVKPVKGKDDLKKLIRLIIDGGSETTFIRKDLSKGLALPAMGTHNIRIQPFGCGTPQGSRICNRVKVRLVNRHNGEEITIVAVEVPEICMDSFACPDAEDPRFENLQLADGQLSNHLAVDGISMLIGADQYWRVVSGETRHLDNGLALVNTKLGWTLHGPNNEHGSDISQVLCTHSTYEDVDISKLWSFDQFGIQDAKVEHDEFVNDYVNTCIEFKGARYEAKLPWMNKEVPLHNNLLSARSRLGTLVRRLKDTGMFEEYDGVIQAYLKEDIVELVPAGSPEVDGRVYYMPHRAVYRENRETTRLRVVFDASSHVNGYQSLNDLLHTGVSLTPDIVLILLRFRNYQLALTADIEKAFLQVALDPRDRDCHRFLWLIHDEVRTFRMKRVTFGIRSSPFMLASTLKKHLGSYESATARLVENSIYVDDLVTGADDVDAALKIQREATAIMKDAGMVLRKWNSNDEELRRQFGAPPEESKVLGVCWGLLTDELGVDASAFDEYVRTNVVNTKRAVLQAVSRLYDPLGMLNPLLITVKIMIQDLWKERVSWDEPVSADMQDRWNKWAQEAKIVSEFRLNRKVLFSKGPIQLHIFCDASARAYGAVAYVVSESRSNYLISRARVAPIKTKEVTLPKLELAATLVGAKLYEYVKTSLGAYSVVAYLWSDSMIALHWLSGRPDKWKPFISNRVTKVQSITSGCTWKYCPTKENLADLVTRVTRIRELQSELWKHGPQWLVGDCSEWPTERVNYSTEALNVFIISAKAKPNEGTLFDVGRFGSLTKLLRVTYNILYFVKKLRKQPVEVDLGVNRSLWLEAETYWLKKVQQGEYYEELTLLRNGRLQLSDLSDDEKHPIILPKTGNFTKLLIRDAHQRAHHAGVSATLARLRTRFWIISGRQAVKSIVSSCVICQRMKKREISMSAAPLPAERVKGVRAFNCVGLDFAGPLYIREPRNEEPRKVYILLFTCASIRAVHLELVGSMSADTFVLALRRFFARRGTPAVIMSDNAKTFKKASKDIAIIQKVILDKSVNEELTRNQIQWKFIVELAPWWGGFWERLVRTVKNALRAVLDRKLLSHDELLTVLTEVEHVVNQRPLTYLSESKDDLLPLRPIDFLLGFQGNKGAQWSVPKDVERTDVLTAWTVHQRVVDKFWSRWCVEYLQELRSANLQRRKASLELQVGDVVVLKDINAKRTAWKLARVERAFPGRDGLVRACEVKTSDGKFLRRPVQHLVHLELDEKVRRTSPSPPPEDC